MAVVLAIAVGFSLFLPGFATAGNALVLLRSVSILGIFSLGMAVVVLGRSVDLSLIAVGVVSASLTSSLLVAGYAPPTAFGLGLLLAVGMGALNGAIIAIFKVPALLATIASALVFVGVARVTVVKSMIAPVPAELHSLLALGRNWLGFPAPLIMFMVLALVLHLFLRFTTVGRFIYAQGENQEAARLTGIPVGALIALEFAISASIGFIGGLAMIASTATINLRAASSTLVFDVLMVVILGGVSLTGGRGGVLSVIAGVLLIGVLLNGMTIMDLNFFLQSVIKGAVLLFAVVLDDLLHPRDEETGRRGG